MRVRVIRFLAGVDGAIVVTPPSKLQPPFGSLMMVLIPRRVFDPAASPRDVSSETIPFSISRMNPALQAGGGVGGGCGGASAGGARAPVVDVPPRPPMGARVSHEPRHDAGSVNVSGVIRKD